jgi:hypothetical protein
MCTLSTSTRNSRGTSTRIISGELCKLRHNEESGRLVCLCRKMPKEFCWAFQGKGGDGNLKVTIAGSARRTKECKVRRVDVSVCMRYLLGFWRTTNDIFNLRPSFRYAHLNVPPTSIPSTCQSQRTFGRCGFRSNATAVQTSCVLNTFQ